MEKNFRNRQEGQRGEALDPDVVSPQPGEVQEISRMAFLKDISAIGLTTAGILAALKYFTPDTEKRLETNSPKLPKLPTDSGKPEKISEPQIFNRPDFLHKDESELHGLSLLIQNRDFFDEYIFNSITGNRSFGVRIYIQGGYDFKFQDREYKMPYAAFLFNAFDKRSNMVLPERLGKAHPHGNILADLFNSVTKYRAIDDIEIKTIVSTSYELSFGIKIPHEHIEIVATPDGRIETIRYIGPNPEALIAKTTIATATESDPENPERHFLTDTEEKVWRVVDRKGNLVFPPTINVPQGIAVPVEAMQSVKGIRYNKTFRSQGKTMEISIRVPIDSILEEQDQLMQKEEPQKFYFDASDNQVSEDRADYMSYLRIMYNMSWYVTDNDPLIQQLAHDITDPFPTHRKKVQAILDFIHTFRYLPDPYGETPHSPRVSLISRGGDCEDSTILALTLARAVGIDGIFLYYKDHITPAFDAGGPGTAIQWGNQKFEWAETTGGMTTMDPEGRVIEDRAWKVGEKSRLPNEDLGPVRYVQRVGGPLVFIQHK